MWGTLDVGTAAGGAACGAVGILSSALGSSLGSGTCEALKATATLPPSTSRRRTCTSSAWRRRNVRAENSAGSDASERDIPANQSWLLQH